MTTFAFASLASGICVLLTAGGCSTSPGSSSEQTASGAPGSSDSSEASSNDSSQASRATSSTRDGFEAACLGLCKQLGPCIDTQTDWETQGECEDECQSPAAAAPTEAALASLTDYFECAVETLPSNYCEIAIESEDWLDAVEEECGPYLEAAASNSSAEQGTSSTGSESGSDSRPEDEPTVLTCEELEEYLACEQHDECVPASEEVWAAFTPEFGSNCDRAVAADADQAELLERLSSTPSCDALECEAESSKRCLGAQPEENQVPMCRKLDGNCAVMRVCECENGDPVPAAYECDGTEDCADGSDEDRCIYCDNASAFVDDALRESRTCLADSDCGFLETVLEYEIERFGVSPCGVALNEDADQNELADLLNDTVVHASCESPEPCATDEECVTGESSWMRPTCSSDGECVLISVCGCADGDGDIPWESQCDGVEDCGDGSDETECAP